MRKYYTGIGSRKAPKSVRPLIGRIVRFLWNDEYVLRSGAAPGADEMFETALSEQLFKGTAANLHPLERRRILNEHQEVYLPWYLFQSNTSPLTQPTPEAIALSLQYHPAPHNLGAAAERLMGRNAHQVLGRDLRTKSDFVLCWTPSGGEEGGTGQAMRIAAAYGIKIYNLNAPGCCSFEAFMKWYKLNNFDIL